MHHERRTSAGSIIGRAYLTLLAAAFLSRVAASLCGVAAGIVVGQGLGTAQLGSLSVFDPVSRVQATLEVAISTGAAYLCFYYQGLGERKRSDAVFTLACLLEVVLGVIFMVVFGPLARPIAELLGASGEAARMAAGYVNGWALGCIPTMLQSFFTTYLVLDGAKGRAVASALTLSIANVVLAWVSLRIFAGTPSDTFGVGFANTIAYFLALAVCLPHFLGSRCSARLRRPRDVRRETAEILKRGSAQGFNRVGTVVFSAIKNGTLIATGGVAALAASGAVSHVRTLIFAFIQAASSTVGGVSSALCGERDEKGLRTLLKVAVRTQLLICLAVSAAVFCAAPVLVRVFGIDDPQTAFVAEQMMRIYAVSILPDALYQLYLSLQCAMGRAALSSGLSLGGTLVVSSPLMLLLSRAMGPVGTWAGIAVASVAMLVVCAVMVLRAGKGLMSARAWLRIPEEWSGEGAQLALDLDGSADSRRQAAEELEAFCREQGIEARQATAAQHVAEEAWALIAARREQEGAAACIDFRMLAQPEGLTIRLRYPGKPYDPLTDPDAAQGLEAKLLAHFASTLDYRFQMDVNNLVFTIAP